MYEILLINSFKRYYMNLVNFSKFFTLVVLLVAGTYLQAQTNLTGTVKDDSGEPLIGASILVEGTSSGTVTDFDGNFDLQTSATPPFNIIVSYTGYSSKTIAVNGSSNNLNIELVEGGINIEEVVVSASRRREKVQEAPASISVLNAKKLAVTSNATDPTRNLVNTAGVQIQQQSANRINISMRGGAGLFGTSVFPIMDYRSLVGPGIGTFQSDQAGINNIDLQRIEVVRGPGSALYGPGVTQGVVHFITKNPIDFPGTTVEVMGGELNTFGGNIRHATKVSDKFGFKINAGYKRGDEFTLDPNDPDDALQIARMTTNGISRPAIKDGIVDPTGTPTQVLSQADLDPDGDGNPMAPDWYNMLANATLEFRPQDDLSVFLSGGLTSARAVFYNEQGEGLSHANEYWAQARMQKGGLFAQIFGVSNDGGLNGTNADERVSYLYQTGNVSAVGRTQLEGQLQYNFDTPGFLDGNWTAGFDYRFSGQNTENLVYGRNEEDDSYSVVGGYVQAKFALLDKMDLVVAGRYDRFNFIDDGAFAPRAALVYKAAPGHTFRASYNRSNSTVSNLQLNIDFPLSVIVPGAFDIWLYGNKTTQTFSDNPTAKWLIGYEGPIGGGLPLAIPHAAVNDATIAGLLPLLPADLVPLVEGVLRGLDPTMLGTTGALSPGYNVFDGSPLGLQDAPISQIATDDNWEFGYKGLIADKLGVTFDIYRVTQRGTSQFTAISPAYAFIGLDNIPSDYANAVAGQAMPQIEAGLRAAGVPEDQIAATLPIIQGGIIQAYTLGGQGFNAAAGAALGTLAATTSTQEVPNNGVTHLSAGYRTFDERTFLGADLGLEYYINADFSLFGNYSWVDKNEFMQNVVGVDGDPLPTYLNIPRNKYRLGLNYAPTTGLKGSLAFQHDDSYFAAAGQYSGDTEVRNLVDASIGYGFDNGLVISITGNNILNNEYRYLPNMPKIGRRVLARVVYDFGGGDE